MAPLYVKRLDERGMLCQLWVAQQAGRAPCSIDRGGRVEHARLNVQLLGRLEGRIVLLRFRHLPGRLPAELVLLVKLILEIKCRDSYLLTWNRLLVGVILIFDEILNNTLQSMIAGVVTPRFALALGR